MIVARALRDNHIGFLQLQHGRSKFQVPTRTGTAFRRLFFFSVCVGALIESGHPIQTRHPLSCITDVNASWCERSQLNRSHARTNGRTFTKQWCRRTSCKPCTSYRTDETDVCTQVCRAADGGRESMAVRTLSSASQWS